MLIQEIKTGLAEQAARIEEANRCVREAIDTPLSGSTVRWAASMRRAAIKYLAVACGSLKGWPDQSLVGEEAASCAQRILMAGDASEIRRMLPLVMAAAKKRSIPAHHYPELADALCVAEKRPQLYGTAYVKVEGVHVLHRISDPRRLNARRALFGLPPHQEFLDRLEGRPSAPEAEKEAQPKRRSDPLPDEFAVLDGLLDDVEPARRFPRTTRRTADAGSPWACAHCGGPAPQGSVEVEVRRQVWRLCLVCSDTRDNPATRLDDVMASWVGKEVASAVTESGLAHLGTYRLPLRMELAGARPNHRPCDSRWAFVPVSAICRLLCMVNELPQRVPAPSPPTAVGEKNPVQRLNELAQRGVITQVRDTYTREGPDHFPWFTCRSVTSTRSEMITVEGKGTSKQKARTEAARLLLQAVTGARRAAPAGTKTGAPEVSLIQQRGHGAASTPEPEPAA
ncbi:DUF6624 domain-containing protein [Streptomyces lavendofoliae]|uniref:DUF6624 domain-containing protein n=1 Tax=Streptomyces lavendofoliae TaxID=67314 RepID=UPI00300F5B92